MNAKAAEIIEETPVNQEIEFIDTGEQYLSFVLGGESYAVDILAVKEIRGWEEATMVPNAPEYVKGVVNLRGTIVPIIDLRIRFSVGDDQYLPTTVVVILSGESETGDRTMGFIVDAVSDVLDVANNDIKPSPEFDGSVPSHYIRGLVNTDHHVVTILDIMHLLSMDN